MNLLEEIVLKVSPELLATRDTQAIADALNVGRVRMVPTPTGRGLILSAIGIDLGNVLLDIFEQEPRFRHVWPLIASGTLDLCEPDVDDALGQVVAAGIGITRAHADAILGRRLVPDPAPELDVRRALFADNGDYLA